MRTIGLNLRVTTDSKQGGRVYMEDVLSVAFEKGLNEKAIEFAYFAVFDGHGGAEAAQFAKQHLLTEIKKCKGFWSDDDEQVLKAIKVGFTNTHKLMWNAHTSWARTPSGYPSTSGSTASVVIIRNQTMYVAHVGDSSVVLGTKCDHGIKADCLTDEHKPNSPAELSRIKDSGGFVIAKAGVNRVVWHRPKAPKGGPIRRSTPMEKIPFLAVARSLGDLWSYNCQQDVFVVSPEPDVMAMKLDPEKHKCLILASDGLWNVVKSQQTVNVVSELEQQFTDQPGEYGGIKDKPASVLVKLALDRWASMSYRADNTSVIVVMIYPPGPSKSEVCRSASIQSTCSTLKLTSESDNDEASGSDVSGSDCDIDLDQGDADDLSLPCNVGKIFPSLDPTGTSVHAKKTVSRNITANCVRNIIRSVPASQGLSSSAYQKHHMHQVKMRKLGRCNTAQSDSITPASHKTNSSPNGNILMEAALNAPPLFKEPAVTKVTTPTKLLHRNHPGQTSDGETSPEMTTLRALRSRSPKHAAENLPGDCSPLTLAGRPRYSLSPSSSFMSNEISPLEATSPRSPLKVDTSLKSGLLPMASVSPLWPSSLETGGESETDPIPCVADLDSANGEDQKLCHTGGLDLLEGHSEEVPSCSENMENPMKGMSSYRVTVKRRAPQSPKTVSTKRPHQSLSQQRFSRTRSHSAHPVTRAHVKSPPKKTKA